MRGVRPSGLTPRGGAGSHRPIRPWRGIIISQPAAAAVAAAAAAAVAVAATATAAATAAAAKSVAVTEVVCG